MRPSAPVFRLPRPLRVVARRAAFLLATAALLIGTAHAGLKEYPFRIETVKSPRQHELTVHNEGPATMTVYLTIEGNNIASDVAWPITRAIPAYTSVRLARLFPDDATRRINSTYSISRQYGDFRAVHSPDVHYRLPYQDGSAFRITQAYGDRLTSHLGHDSQHAIDFAMPEGTPVLAARDGVIIDATLDYEAGGISLDLQDKANSIAILHDDGTVAQYAHLAKRGTLVKLGERVRAGTVIGYSGNTGYSSGPHLHFAVIKPEVLADGRVGHVALPIKFYVDTWTLPFEPRRGALVTASYAGDSTRRAAQVSSREPQGALSHEPVAVSLIPVKAPATADRAAMTTNAAAGQAAADNTPPVQMASVSFESAGVVPMQRASAPQPTAPAVTPQANQALEQPTGNAVRVAEDRGWTLLEMALAGLAAALVLLFGGYFRGQAALARGFRAD